MAGPDVRAVALDLLTEITENGVFCHTALEAARQKYAWMADRDLAFLTRLVRGTLEKLYTIDHILDRVSSVRTRKMKPVIRNILRLSAYQVLFMDGVPDRAAVFEGAELARKRRFAGLTGFVNGVLRRIASEKEEILAGIEKDPDLSVRYSCPPWIVRTFTDTLGRETAETVLSAFAVPQPVTVRLLKSRGAVPPAEGEHLPEGGEAAGRPVFTRLPYGEELFTVSGFSRLDDVPLIRDGKAYVQDLGSALAAEAACPGRDSLVLDVCAAPGGKSIAAADIMGGTGTVLSFDVREEKAELIRRNAARTGMGNIKASVGDARVFDPALAEKADVVIADLPCSGLGCLGGKPDIRFRQTEEGAGSLAALQREILENVSRYVKKGGRLVYSTCTIDRAENEDNFRGFLEAHPDFIPEDLTDRLGSLEGTRGAEHIREGRVQLLPGIHPSDGFFIASMRRRA